MKFVILTLVEMRAVVICFYATVGIRGVDVESIEVCAYLFYRGKILLSWHWVSANEQPKTGWEDGGI